MSQLLKELANKHIPPTSTPTKTKNKKKLINRVKTHKTISVSKQNWIWDAIDEKIILHNNIT